jgi:hypothetical protein
LFVAGEIVEVRGVLEREFQGFKRVVKAQQADGASEGLGGSQDGDGIGGGAQADIPDDEFTGVAPETFNQPKLPDIQRLRLGDGADDRVEGLGMGQRVNAMSATGELDDSVSGGRGHGQNFNHDAAAAKLKRNQNQKIGRLPPTL